MRKSKAKLELDNAILQMRIEYLENLVCPCHQHDWIKVDYYFVGGTGHGDETTIYKYQCRRCNKKTSTYKML